MYHRADNVDSGICSYCHAPRECLDHVPPLRLAIDLDLKKFFKNGGRLLLYPSCQDCNLFLGNKHLATYRERLAYLYGAYTKKIKLRSWEKEEMAELGYGLRKYIEASDTRNKELIGKLHQIEENLLRLEDDV